MSQQSIKVAKTLNITETSVIKKCEEFHRLLLLKPNININANDKFIICLDIAAEILGYQFDSKEAISQSNLRKPQYLCQRRNVGKLLGLNKSLSCAEVCIRLKIDKLKQVQAHAERLLTEYRALPINHETDFSHPQYVCMAIYMSCQRHKVKIKMTDILPISTIKLAQWSKLQIIWSKCMEKNKAMLNDRPVTSIAVNEAITTEITPHWKEKKEVEPESYEAWRDRMIKKAKADIEKQQKQDEDKKKES